MPLVDSGDASLWDGGPTSLYRARVNGQSVGYTRAAMQMYLGNDGYRLREVLNIQPGQSIILVGAGFGWVAEQWMADGYGPLVAIDTSPWIEANKAQNSTITIYAEDMETNQSRGRVRQALGLSGNQRATWCISEDVVGLLADAEAAQMAERMRIVGTNVAHWISCGVRRFDNPNVWAGDSRLNWKTLEDWKTLLAPDLVVARNENGRVL
jgi:hypothetical protein